MERICGQDIGAKLLVLFVLSDFNAIFRNIRVNIKILQARPNKKGRSLVHDAQLVVTLYALLLLAVNQLVMLELYHTRDFTVVTVLLAVKGPTFDQKG